jgi:sulfur transfer complex TusBCD TusB component (DsrH family)
MKGKSIYIGDGVYASFDGYHVWLAVNDHSNKAVALGPDVFANLARFVENIPNMIEEEKKDD